jgi:hypothetical protein
MPWNEALYPVSMKNLPLRELVLRPMRLRRLRLERAGGEDAAWLAGVLRRVSGTNVERAPGNRLRLQ